jgi:hypothetical protein
MPKKRSSTQSRSCPRGAPLAIGLIVLLLTATARAQPTSIVQVESNEAIAFARYVAWIHERDPFIQSGLTALDINASRPGLAKQGHLLAIRGVGESERSEYLVLEAEGDATVWEQAIVPYLLEQRHAEDLPLSSLMITPLNYEFQYVAAVGTGDNSAYVFRITPRKNRAGLIRGELWIEPLTGAPVLVVGSILKTDSTSCRSIRIVCETKVLDGCTWVRTTHMTIQVRPAGRIELNIVEVPLGLSGE